MFNPCQGRVHDFSGNSTYAHSTAGFRRDRGGLAGLLAGLLGAGMPVSRCRSGAGQLSDAEDVASQTFEVLWESRLLVRWIANRSAKLRSLLCSVTRKTLANRKRVRAGRERLARDAADQWAQPEMVGDETVRNLLRSLG